MASLAPDTPEDTSAGARAPREENGERRDSRLPPSARSARGAGGEVGPPRGVPGAIAPRRDGHARGDDCRRVDLALDDAGAVGDFAPAVGHQVPVPERCGFGVLDWQGRVDDVEELIAFDRDSPPPDTGAPTSRNALTHSVGPDTTEWRPGRRD